MLQTLGARQTSSRRDLSYELNQIDESSSYVLNTTLGLIIEDSVAQQIHRQKRPSALLPASILIIPLILASMLSSDIPRFSPYLKLSPTVEWKIGREYALLGVWSSTKRWSGSRQSNRLCLRMGTRSLFDIILIMFKIDSHQFRCNHMPINFIYPHLIFFSISFCTSLGMCQDCLPFPIYNHMFKASAQQQKACCPFNKNHIFAREKLIFHINRCKDRQKVAHLFATCQFNGLHFVKKEQLDMHELTCPDKLEVRRMVETMKRNYNTMRERSRSRERREKAEEEDEGDRPAKKEESDQEADEDVTLSDCEQCQEMLRGLNINDHPKLKKYLVKYEQLSTVKFEH